MRREENGNDQRKSFVQSEEYPNLAERPFGFKMDWDKPQAPYISTNQGISLHFLPLMMVDWDQ